MSHSAGATSSAAFLSGTAALLTSTSIGPRALTASAIAFSMLACERTSSATGAARAPAACIIASTLASFSGRVEETATSNPSRAKATAIAAPIPCDAPVTKAVRLTLDMREW